MERLTIAVGSYEVNCSILSKEGKAYIVDPGQEGERIIGLLAKKGLEPAAILLTHAHFDHITGIAALQKAFPELPVYVHSADRKMFGHPFNQMPSEYASIGTPANLREADDIYIRGLRNYDCSSLHLPSASDPRVEAKTLYDAIWQAGVILLPIKSVGVMGDERTYENPVALRAVVSTDAMTADWFHFPYDFLANVSNEIINKVKGVNRVVYDISSKPPATIEWE